MKVLIKDIDNLTEKLPTFKVGDGHCEPIFKQNCPCRDLICPEDNAIHASHRLLVGSKSDSGKWTLLLDSIKKVLEQINILKTNDKVSIVPFPTDDFSQMKQFQLIMFIQAL